MVRQAGDCTVAAYLHERHRATVDRVDPLRDLIPTEVRDRVDEAAKSVDERVRSSSTSASFQTGEQLVLLHGDPGAANVIWTPEPVLIDWEYARLGDPADEVAFGMAIADAGLADGSTTSSTESASGNH